MSLSSWHRPPQVCSVNGIRRCGLIAAFSIFCVVASGTYLVNDVVDAESDRHHPVKGLRPVASGALRPSLALGVGFALIATALVSAMAIGPWGFAVVVASYAGLSIAYSTRLKQRTRDGTCGGRFVLRVAGRCWRCGGGRATLELVSRLHLVRRSLHRYGETLRRARSPRGRTGRPSRRYSTSTASHSSNRP